MLLELVRQRLRINWLTSLTSSRYRHFYFGLGRLLSFLDLLIEIVYSALVSGSIVFVVDGFFYLESLNLALEALRYSNSETLLVKGDFIFSIKLQYCKVHTPELYSYLSIMKFIV